MNQPLQNCPHCGANLSLDDLRGTDCPYCHTALPHHAQAAEHAALVNQMLAQQGVNYQIPYEHGAPPPPMPMGPYAGNPGFVPMHPHVAQQVQHSLNTANKAITTSVIIGIVVAVAIGLIVVVAAGAMIVVRML